MPLGAPYVAVATALELLAEEEKLWMAGFWITQVYVSRLGPRFITFRTKRHPSAT